MEWGSIRSCLVEADKTSLLLPLFQLFLFLFSFFFLTHTVYCFYFFSLFKLTWTGFYIREKNGEIQREGAQCAHLSDSLFLSLLLGKREREESRNSMRAPVPQHVYYRALSILKKSFSTVNRVYCPPIQSWKIQRKSKLILLPFLPIQLGLQKRKFMILITSGVYWHYTFFSVKSRNIFRFFSLSDN